jgi:SAM-dependent methyltransferase
MTLLENFKKRVADIGFRNTVSLILKNKVYRHVDRLFLVVGKSLWKNALLRDTLVLESHNDFDCNGGAFYDYLIENGYNERYRIVWLIKHKKPCHLPKNVQCFNIFRPSLRKTYHICTAKYLSCDDVITEKVRPEQKSFYLTHGVFGLKDVRGKIMIPESVDYVLAASPLLDTYEAEQMSISRHAERLIHVGLPCHDLLLGVPTGELKKVTDGSFDKVVAGNVIHLLDAPMQALRELNRVCKRAGSSSSRPT